MEDALIDNSGTAQDEESHVPTGDVEIESANWKVEAGVQDNPSFDRFNGSADLAKSYSELESHLKTTAIRFPSEEAGQEDRDKFSTKMGDHGWYQTPDREDTDGIRKLQGLMGMPKDANSYVLNEIEGLAVDEEGIGAFKEMAHGAGLTAEQANAVNSWYGGNVAKENSLRDEFQQRSFDDYKRENGQAFEHKMQQNENTVRALSPNVPGLSEAWDQMKADGGFDPVFVRTMDIVGGMLGESGAMPADPRTAMTTQEAWARIDEINGDNENPGNAQNEGKRGYDEARIKLMDLYRIAGPRPIVTY